MFDEVALRSVLQDRARLQAAWDAEDYPAFQSLEIDGRDFIRRSVEEGVRVHRADRRTVDAPTFAIAILKDLFYGWDTPERFVEWAASCSCQRIEPIDLKRKFREIIEVLPPAKLSFEFDRLKIVDAIMLSDEWPNIWALIELESEYLAIDWWTSG